jgi:hypothetical protein
MSYSQMYEEIVKLAVTLYYEYTDNHPTIHSNRFELWQNLDDTSKVKWILEAHKILNED